MKELDGFFIATVTCEKTRDLIGDVLIYIEIADEDVSPHFHYRRADGTDIAISLTEPVYCQPVTNVLTMEEIEKMKIFFATKHSCGDTFFSDLLWLWNNQNQTDLIDSHYIAVDERMDLPDYTKLLLSTENNK